MGRFAITLVSGTLVSGALLAGGAQASSIVALKAMQAPASPSIIVLGTPEMPAMVQEQTVAGMRLAYPFPGSQPPAIVDPAGSQDMADGGFVATSPSNAAMAAPGGPVSGETVAATGGGKHDDRRRERAPMVIRGGLVGDAFVRTAATAPAPRKTASAETRASRSQPGASSGAPVGTLR